MRQMPAARPAGARPPEPSAEAPRPPGRVMSPRDSLLLRARHEVLHFDVPPYLSVDNGTQLDQLARGVVYRTVYGQRAVEYPGALVRIDQCLEAGEKARVTARLPMKMMIVDRERAVLAVAADVALRPGTAVVITHGPLLDGLIELFERVWAESVPLDPAGAVVDAQEGELNPEEARLLALLLSGLTDDAVARHLGIARRTVVRRARSLMDRAGVATRMQLGWHAARRGWIEVPG
ncbi:hypothetical protein [Streptomyces sp. NBC_00385]|uniref:hypothetical protein n=1 Tax=Streptomyces sp. NBC_00385 TaxID=2975733 RepID=UPI002DDB0707|nr:hypothetical protein [Streptomyces sp. NBC_00385]WRZ02940.1 hypothetical protein OG959_06055 [Streptomyces sp. NBC_00385]